MASRLYQKICPGAKSFEVSSWAVVWVVRPDHALSLLFDIVGREVYRAKSLFGTYGQTLALK